MARTNSSAAAAPLAVKTGTWRASLPVYGIPPSPCRSACPVGGRIAQWMQQAAAGQWRAAWETLTDLNPFPAVSGRVCHHPCESACNRAGFDEALAICALERAIGDRGIEEGWRFEPALLNRQPVPVRLTTMPTARRPSTPPERAWYPSGTRNSRNAATGTPWLIAQSWAWATNPSRSGASSTLATRSSSASALSLSMGSTASRTDCVLFWI